MRYILFILLIANGRLAYTQSNSCNCLVKLIAYNLNETWQSLPFDDRSGIAYHKLTDLTNNKPSVYVVNKDSLGFILVKATNKDSVTIKNFKLKKLREALTTNIVFNNLDSIAIYSEPKKSAKILTYIKKEKKALTKNEKSLGYELNDHWFSGCETGWVKIRVYDRDKKKKTKVIGWVNIERK